MVRITTTFYAIIYPDQKRRTCVITYEPFWRTLKESEESTYTLIYKHHISSSTIDRLRNDKPINTTTINDLCLYSQLRYSGSDALHTVGQRSKL